VVDRPIPQRFVYYFRHVQWNPFCHCEMVRLLLDRGADIHAVHGAGPGSASGYAAAGFQPIDLALWNGPFWGIRGDDDDYRSTPLAWAARSDLPDMVELLLTRGTPTSLPNDEPWATPLSWATRRGHGRITEILRRAGATD